MFSSQSQKGEIMVNTYPGSLDDYFKYCDEENRIERQRREEYITSSKTFCEHDRSFVQRCTKCEGESDDNN